MADTNGRWSAKPPPGDNYPIPRRGLELHIQGGLMDSGRQRQWDDCAHLGDCPMIVYNYRALDAPLNYQNFEK